MRDFLPSDKKNRETLISRIRANYNAHGFQEVETPAIEEIDRLTSGEGGDNEKLAFQIIKRGGDLIMAKVTNDQLTDLGLRYDLTVPLTRYYASNKNKLPKVFKSIQIGPVWRAERPQKGRFRQFMQCDIDIIGDSSVVAEVDLLAATLSTLETLGLGEAVIRVNHRWTLKKLLESWEVPDGKQLKTLVILDKLDKIGVDGVSNELESWLGYEFGERFQAWISSPKIQAIPEDLREIFEVFGNERLRYDPTLVRGMGYYTGPIFEIEHPGSGSSIGGGGRYDGMVGKWLGQEVPAVGISLGFERVMDLVSPSLFASSGDAVVLVLEGDVLAKAVEIRDSLIAQGYRVRFENRPKKLNGLLESMAANGFTHFATLDESTTEIELRPIS